MYYKNNNNTFFSVTKTHSVSYNNTIIYLSAIEWKNGEL